jgi:hypothetical protein
MNKNLLFSIFLCVLFFFPGIKCFAQLSGTVTINSAGPTVGTNYQNFTALANVLNSNGVNGPLVVNVVPGNAPYIEQVTFNQAPGISATNTITINGNNNMIQFTATSSAQPWTLLMNGADHMHFNKLVVAGNGTTYAHGCNLYNGADNNSFSACTFSCPSNGISSNHIPVAITQASTGFVSSSTLTSGSNNSFVNCKIFNGYYGLVVTGPTITPYASGNSFVNCEISDWAAYGTFIQRQTNLTLKKSSFSRPTRSTFLGNYGITFIDNRGGLLVQDNCITNLFNTVTTNTIATYAIYHHEPNNITGLPADNISYNVINNLGASGYVYGMWLYTFNGSCSNNTVILNNSTSTNTSVASAYGIYTYPSYNDSTKYLNNFISITQAGNGVKYGLYLATTGKTIANHNKYFIAPATGTGYIGYAPNVAAAPTFTYWQGGGYDATGTNYSVNPNFTITSPCGVQTPTTSTVTVSAPTEFQQQQIVKIFPNPAHEKLTMEMNMEGNKLIRLYDMTGRIVSSTSTPEERFTINIEKYPKGIYFLRISNETYTEVLKLMKE